MKYHAFFFRKLGKMLENLSSAAVVIGTLTVNYTNDNKSLEIFQASNHEEFLNKDF